MTASNETAKAQEKEAALLDESNHQRVQWSQAPLQMLLRRGIDVSLAELDLPFDPNSIDQESLAKALERYAFRLFLRGAIQHRDGFSPLEITKFLSTEHAVHCAQLACELQLLRRNENDSYQLIRGASSFGGTLEWYVAYELRARLALETAAGVKLCTSGIGGDLDVVGSADGKLIVVELKSSPPKHISQEEIESFLLRSVAIRPDVSIFVLDTALRLKDKIVGMFEEATKRISGLSVPLVRLQQDIWMATPKLFLTNAKPHLMNNITFAIKHAMMLQAPPLF